MTVPDISRQRIVDTALIGAALCEPDDAARAWNQLPPDFDLDEIRDPDRHRILPAIAANLTAAGSTSRELPRLKGVQRKSAVEQQLFARRAAELAGWLAAEGISPGAVGGVALARASWAYRDRPGERWVDDTRFVVDPRDAARACAVLERRGVGLPQGPRLERRLAWFWSVPIQFADGPWGQLAWAPSAFMRDATVTLSERIDVSGSQFRSLTAEQSLVWVCAEAEWGWRRFGAAWMLDADRIVRSGSCDLSAATAMARTLGLGDVVDRRLTALDRTRHGAPAVFPDPASTPGWTRLRLDARAYAHGRRRTELVRGAVPFVLERWGLSSVTQLPRAVARRATRSERRPAATWRPEL